MWWVWTLPLILLDETPIGPHAPGQLSRWRGHAILIQMDLLRSRETGIHRCSRQLLPRELGERVGENQETHIWAHPTILDRSPRPEEWLGMPHGCRRGPTRDLPGWTGVVRRGSQQLAVQIIAQERQARQR